MISTEMTAKEDNIYQLTKNGMISLPMITKCASILSVSDNSKNIIENQWYNYILSDMGYHSATNKYLFEETEYFILLRFLDNSHQEPVMTEMTIVQFSLQKIIDHIIKSRSSVIQKQDSY